MADRLHKIFERFVEHSDPLTRVSHESIQEVVDSASQSLPAILGYELGCVLVTESPFGPAAIAFGGPRREAEGMRSSLEDLARALHREGATQAALGPAELARRAVREDLRGRDGRGLVLAVPLVLQHGAAEHRLGVALLASSGTESDQDLDLRVLEILVSRVSASILACHARNELVQANELLRRQVLERTRAEEHLRESETRFRTLVENAPDVIVMLDVQSGRFVDVNENAVRFFGLAREELLRVGPGDLSPPVQPDGSDSESVAREWIGRAMNGEAPIFEWVHRNSSGEDVPCEVRLVRLPASDRDLVRGSILDITERRRGEDEREQLLEQVRLSQKMEALGTLAGGIAHDFNNILIAISGYSGLVRDRITDDDDARQKLDEVLDAAERARRLVQQILTFSRQESRALDPADLSKVVQDSMGIIRASLPATIEIRTRLEAHLPAILADENQIQQVILNLCSNAGHAMPRGGKLDIRTEVVQLDREGAAAVSSVDPGAYVRLVVEDTGEGIDADAQERIFDPFFTTKGPEAGTGLGLSVVHGIVSSHGGAIQVKSAPGVGTEFELFFPVAAESAQAPAPERPSAVRGGKERILVVDDEEQVTSVTLQWLRRLGYQVQSQSDSRSALELIRSDPHSIDLVLTDRTMPGMTGIELAEEVRVVRPALPVVLTTGFLDARAAERVAGARIDAVIQKPYSGAELGRVVREVLDRAS